MRSSITPRRVAIAIVTTLSALVLACGDATGPLSGVTEAPEAANHALASTSGSISIAVDSSLNLAQKVSATATVKDASGRKLSGRTIAWSVSDPRVISAVTTNATRADVTGVAQGTALLTATSDGLSATVRISVVPIATVSATLAASSVEAGQTTQATLTAKDASGNLLTGRVAAWSSLNPSIATVASTGLVTAVAVGTATIRATVDSKTADVSLTVVTPAPTIGTEMSLVNTPAGRCLNVTANQTTPGGRIVIWDCATWWTQIFNVRPAGTSAPVTVNSATLCLAEASGTGAEGALVTTATCTGAAGQRWTLTTAGQFKHTSSGKCAMPLSGSSENGMDVAITACTGSTAENWTSRTAAVTVAVASAQVSLAASSVEAGQTTQATLTAKDAAGNVLTGRVVAWSSLSPSLATVSATGLVTAVAAGSATIRATVESKIADASLSVVTPAPVLGTDMSLVNTPAGRCLNVTANQTTPGGRIVIWDCVTWWTQIFNVRPAGTSSPVTVNGATLCLAEASGAGDEGSLLTTATCSGAAGQQWTLTTTGQFKHTSSGKCAMPVSGTGANGADVAITACTGSTAENWTSRSAVSPPAPVAVTSVQTSLALASLSVGQTTQATATPKDVSANVLTGRVVGWSSLNPSIATVSSTGFVTALASGTATIRATVETVNGDASLTVATQVTVAAASVTATLASASLTAGGTTQATAVTRDVNGAVLTGRTIAWSSLNTSMAVVSATGLVTSLVAGTTAIRATVETKTGDAALTVAAPIVVPPSAATAELPRVYLNTSMSNTPSAGRTLRVPAGANLQKALDTAVAGDRILLAAGATFTGNFMVTPRTGGIAGGWITLQTDGALPPEGSRVTPAQAAAMQYPKLVSAAVNPVLAVRGAASRWRFIGIEFTYSTAVPEAYTMIECGYGDETSDAALPTDLIFDRVYIHGHANLDARRGIGLNSQRTAVIDSYISDIHSTFDAQALMGWNGPGPYKIVNNYLEASGENINWGGAGVSNTNNVPSDIEIRRNHLYKPLAWKGRWLEKNMYESKFSRRVLVEGNVFENSWQDGQSGWSVVLWSAAAGNGNAWIETSHQTWRYNIFKNVAAGVQLYGRGYTYDNPIAAHDYSFHDNVWIGLGNESGSYGRLMDFGVEGVTNLSWEHNTVFTPNNSTIVWSGGLTDAVNANMKFKNNLTGGGTYHYFASDGMGADAWNHHTKGVSENLGNTVVGTYGSYPSGNDYPATFAAVGLVGGGAAATSVTSTIDQLALSASSPYKGKGTDGRDPGADISAVRAATANVVIP